VREEVVPKVREAAAPAVAAALAHRQASKPKKHRLRKLLFIVGLGGAAAYAAKRFGLLGQSGDSSFGETSPSGSSYAGTGSTSTPARPSAVPDAREDGDPLHGGAAEAAGATFADADTELGRDLTDKLSEDETSEGTQDTDAESTSSEDETSGAQDTDADVRSSQDETSEVTPEESATGSKKKKTS